MALSASQVWELRTTGADTNGGAFKAGASGTDYSVQDAAQIAVADAVTNGTATITSATAAFAAAHVGNACYVTGGTGAVAASRYEVISVTNATTIVVDRSTGLTAGTGATLNLGGALLTFGELANSTRGMVASNKAFVKTGTYVVNAGVTFGQNVANPNNATLASQIVGYKTTRGDISFGVNAASRPLVTTNTASLNVISLSQAGWQIQGITIGAGTQTPGTGFNVAGNYVNLLNCAVTAYSSYGIYIAANGGVQLCEVSGGVAATEGIHVGPATPVVGCYVHDGASVGINSASNGLVAHNVVANMTGAGNDGIASNGGSQILYNTVYNCARHGIAMTSIYAGTVAVKGNILAKNGGYGLTNLAGAGLPAKREWDGNAYWMNTSGSRINLDDAGAVNPVNGVAPYTNTLDVALVADLAHDPFTNRAGGDFTLNNTAISGALLRGTAPFNTWPGLAQTGYRDFGAIQHQDAAGTTITTFIEG